jgi:phage shock protein C
MDQTRKLYRSRTNRMLGGVCGGLAQYFNTDATLIRVLFVVLAVLGGAGGWSTWRCGSLSPRSRQAQGVPTARPRLNPVGIWIKSRPSAARDPSSWPERP